MTSTGKASSSRRPTGASGSQRLRPGSRELAFGQGAGRQSLCVVIRRVTALTSRPKFTGCRPWADGGPGTWGERDRLLPCPLSDPGGTRRHGRHFLRCSRKTCELLRAEALPRALVHAPLRFPPNKLGPHQQLRLPRTQRWPKNRRAVSTKPPQPGSHSHSYSESKSNPLLKKFLEVIKIIQKIVK